MYLMGSRSTGQYRSDSGLGVRGRGRGQSYVSSSLIIRE
jgi:hypothetical protein